MPDYSFSGYRMALRLLVVIAVIVVAFTIIASITQTKINEPTITGFLIQEANISINIPGLIISEDSNSTRINLTEYTSSPTPPRYVVVDESRSDIIKCTTGSNMLECSPIRDRFGLSRVTVMAILGPNEAQSTFDVIVNPQPDRVSLKQVIPPIRVREGQKDLLFDLSPYLHDPDGSPLNITSNRVQGLIVFIDGSLVRIKVTEVWEGDGYLRFTAWKNRQRTDSNLVRIYRGEGTLW